MKKYIAAFALLASAGVAQTNNVTAVTKQQPYIGSAPIVAYVSGTLTGTAAPVAVAMPSSTATVASYECQYRNAAGEVKPVGYTISTTTNRIVIASSTVNASGTVNVGDRINCTLHYTR